MKNISDSSHLQKAKKKLSSVRGSPLSLEQRKKETIELASLVLEEAILSQTGKEKRMQAQLARMMHDAKGKAFTTSMTDQCFRSHKTSRVADQLIYLLKKFGVPSYLSFFKKVQLHLFLYLGKTFSFILVPLAIHFLRKETSSVILPGEKSALLRHIHLRKKQKVRLNLNHLGEAILGEKEAKTRLEVYLEDLKQPHVEYVSIKISTIYSQINLVAWDQTLQHLSERLRLLYRAALQNTFRKEDGSVHSKFVNLDMEEYKDLHLTKELFKKVLDEEEFLHFSAGIVLQAYLPDSFKIQQELTEWAKKRVSRGGAPIKIRIVKGANLGMEQVEASLKEWSQAPYKHKLDVDANFKKMVSYGCIKENAKAVFLGIGSHNLFDICYAMLLREENEITSYVTFEMLEGMADHIRRAVQLLTEDILLYCPVAKKEDFQSAVAYLIRRLDENTGPENFLRHTFGLKPGSQEWQEQADFFCRACERMEEISLEPRRSQNRQLPVSKKPLSAPFENEADTDFSLPANRDWVHDLLSKWKKTSPSSIPLVIAGKEIHQASPEGIGIDPAYPDKTYYTYSLASAKEVEDCISSAERASKEWNKKSPEERAEALSQVAHILRNKRGELLCALVSSGGKTVAEGDPEISEAIDFAEYYARSLLELYSHKDISWTNKGTVLVTPPWNFPVAIPCGGILAALAMGNSVIFKPAPETVLCGWVLVNLLWEAGIPKDVLQFLNCVDEPIGSSIIKDPRIHAIILTGATATAKLFLSLRPGVDLSAETGGKNSLIVTSIADHDLAIKDIIHSAFGHSGQKCSAASLLILEADLYDNLNFRKQLQDATTSLKVGPAWDFSSKVVPLIRPATGSLLQGLTTLEKGESWLVEPKQDPKNPNLWSPGIKFGVKENSFTHQTELFGPVLGVMRAKDLDHALELANGTAYGLTSGLHSLDEREHKKWLRKIEAGNLYINRSTTGAIVKRQPFGGCKASSFGHGSKAGGPNYLSQFGCYKEVGLPTEKNSISEPVLHLSKFLQSAHLSPDEMDIFRVSAGNYSYWFKKGISQEDPTKILGQDNFFSYRKNSHLALRIQKNDQPLALFRIFAASLTAGSHLTISYSVDTCPIHINYAWKTLSPDLEFIEESEEAFCKKVEKHAFTKIRLASPASQDLKQSASKSGVFINALPVVANGRFEILNYVREVAISSDYHRYGNLGIREGEARKVVL